MKAARLNLAERPFVNERPARRTTIALWVIALLLLALNVMVYQRHLSGQQEQREMIVALGARIAEERTAITGLEGDLAALDLKQQNQEVVFLNTQIARRTFSWSRLLDRLAEVLPETIQLRRLSPRIVDRGGQRLTGAQSRSAEAVAIDMGGIARSSEAVLDFVDRLFEHPSFTAPNLASEWEQDQNRYEFSLSVLYLPTSTTADVSDAEAAGVETGTQIDRVDSAGGAAEEPESGQPSAPTGERR